MEDSGHSRQGKNQKTSKEYSLRVSQKKGGWTWTKERVERLFRRDGKGPAF